MNASRPPVAPKLDELVMIAQPSSPAAEAYRTLRANLQPKAVAAPKTILFTSSGADADSTMVLVNVGIAAALGGSRVILVDADLRRPCLHEIFGLANEDGLAPSIQRTVAGPTVVRTTKVNGLRVLTSGPIPQNPVELLSVPAVKTLLDSLAEEADLVMLDSPPAGTLADASVLAGWVDGVVLVLDARRTRREDAIRAKVQLERVEARILGTVMSNARVNTSGYSY